MRYLDDLKTIAYLGLLSGGGIICSVAVGNGPARESTTYRYETLVVFLTSVFVRKCIFHVISLPHVLVDKCYVATIIDHEVARCRGALGSLCDGNVHTISSCSGVLILEYANQPIDLAEVSGK